MGLRIIAAPLRDDAGSRRGSSLTLFLGFIDIVRLLVIPCLFDLNAIYNRIKPH